MNCSCKIAYKKHNNLTFPVIEHNRQILRALQHSIMVKNKSIIGWSLHALMVRGWYFVSLSSSSVGQVMYNVYNQTVTQLFIQSG